MIALRRLLLPLAAACLAAISAPIAAQPNADALRTSLVQVVADGVRVRSGFSIDSEGHVLTVAHGVATARNITVAPLASGAAMPARVIHSDKRADLALLAVDGLQRPPLYLAQDGFAPGRLVYSAGAWEAPGGPPANEDARDSASASMSMSEGAVGSHGEIEATSRRPAIGLVLHNAMIPAVGYGGPLLNECGEVAGVNRGSPHLQPRQLRADQAPEGAVHAAGVRAVAGFLLPTGVAFAQSDASCAEARAVSEARAAEATAAAEAAQARAESAAAEAAEAQARAEQATRQADESAAELQDRQQALEQAEARVAALEEQHGEAVRSGAAEAGALQSELDAARTEREAAQESVTALEDALARERSEREAEAEAGRQRTMLWALAALLALVAVACFVVFAHRRRTRQMEDANNKAARAEQDAAQAREEAERIKSEAPPDDALGCLLAGKAGDGRPVSIKVPGKMLHGEGAVIGRSATRSDFVVFDETVSRAHARLRCDAEGGLNLEDLESTNGTRLNGRSLPPGKPARLSDADAVELGDVKLRLSWEG